MHRNNTNFYSNFNSERPDLAVKHPVAGGMKSQSIVKKANGTNGFDPTKKKMVGNRAFGRGPNGMSMATTNKFELYSIGGKKVY